MSATIFLILSDKRVDFFFYFIFFNQLSEVVDEKLKEKVNTLKNILTMQRLFS